MKTGMKIIICLALFMIYLNVQFPLFENYVGADTETTLEWVSRAIYVILFFTLPIQFVVINSFVNKIYDK